MENLDPGSGMEKSRIRDPGWIKVGSGINIPWVKMANADTYRYN